MIANYSLFISLQMLNSSVLNPDYKSIHAPTSPTLNRSIRPPVNEMQASVLPPANIMTESQEPRAAPIVPPPPYNPATIYVDDVMIKSGPQGKMSQEMAKTYNAIKAEARVKDISQYGAMCYELEAFASQLQQ